MSRPIAVAVLLIVASSALAAEPTTSPYLPTQPNTTPAPSPAAEGMVWIPGGEFSMGSDEACEGVCQMPNTTRDSQPVHRVYLDGYWIDSTEVTNEQYEKFVKATGYVTIAEIKPKQEDFPTAPPENLVAGSTVFTPTPGPVPLNNHYEWWRYEKGADWRHPEGPKSDIKGKEKFPVVQIAYDDAVAYAKWAGKRLPTEAEFEFAARGGLTGKIYAWGDDFMPGGKHMANTFQGQFPVKDTGEDGFTGPAPVGKFPANAYGIYDMAGNVWEWCSDLYRPDYFAQLASAGIAKNPQGPTTSMDLSEPGVTKHVQRGGSFLCTDQYCTKYMVGTRGRGEPSTASNHVGFRCVMVPTTKPAN